MGILFTAIALFGLAAILGLYLVTFVLQNKETPKGIAFTHGGLAATALILLIIYTVNNSDTFTALILLVIAALGGFILIIRDLSGKSLPKALALIHGLVAVSGFVALLIYVFNQ